VGISNVLYNYITFFCAAKDKQFGPLTKTTADGSSTNTVPGLKIVLQNLFQPIVKC
jgi:hypothetical protein